MIFNLLSPCLMAAALLSNFFPVSALASSKDGESSSLASRQDQSKYVAAHFMVSQELYRLIHPGNAKALSLSTGSIGWHR